MQPVRVLHVVSIMDPGGIETLLMNLFRAIDRSMIQFDFLVQREQKGFFEDEIESYGGLIYRVPYVSKVGPWKYKKLLTGFFKAHPEYQIVHSHLNTVSGLVLEAAKKAGVPVQIAHSHSSSPETGFLEGLFKNLYCKSKIPRVATHFFACSQAAGSWLFGEKISNTSLKIIKNGIDVEKFSFNGQSRMQSRKALGLADNAFVVGHVGRFHPLKNHSFLVDVFAEIYKRNKNAVLLLIGDGERKAEIETKVQKLGLAQAVLFLGVRSDVNLLMQAMDVFVFPSRYEGLGVSLIEAQAAGLPCVISDAIPQEVGVVDYLIKRVSLEKDVIEWAEAVLGCPQQERVNTTERITQKGFSIQQTAKKLQDFYLQEYYNVLTLPADLKGR